MNESLVSVCPCFLQQKMIRQDHKAVDVTPYRKQVARKAFRRKVDRWKMLEYDANGLHVMQKRQKERPPVLAAESPERVWKRFYATCMNVFSNTLQFRRNRK